MTKRAGIYCRISKDAEGRGLGVQRQEKACRKLAEQHGVDVVGLYVDNDLSAYSGKRRRGYEELVEAIKAGEVDVVLAWHPDRITRSTKELESLIDLLDASKVDVLTVAAGEYDLATPSGRMMARVVGATARYESEHKSERLRFKSAELADKGLPSGGRAPYGYTWEHPDRDVKKGNLVPDVYESKWLRWMAEYVLDGWSLLRTSNELNARGVPTRMGRPWHHSTVRSVLTNPSAAGLRVHRREIVGPAAWEAVLDRETWDRLCATLKDPARKQRRSATVYVLTGLVYSPAGEKLIGRFDGKRYYSTKPGAVDQVSMDADWLEERIIEMAFIAHEANGPWDEPLADDDDVADELAAIEEQMDLLAAQVGSGLTAQQLLVANAPLMKRRGELLARRPARGDVGRLLAQPTDELVAGFPHLDVEQRRRVLAEILAGHQVVVAPIAAGASRKFWKRTAAERVHLRAV